MTNNDKNHRSGSGNSGQPSRNSGNSRGNTGPAQKDHVRKQEVNRTVAPPEPTKKK